MVHGYEISQKQSKNCNFYKPLKKTMEKIFETMEIIYVLMPFSPFFLNSF